jgi:dTDP-4-amino-4,6-dideoxygalactose transaminase
MNEIPFSRPYTSGNELKYIQDLLENGKKLSGNGEYTKKCHAFFQDRYNVEKVLLTTSCTDALEMAAILCDIKPGDEVIIPSFTFVSTANAFVLRGAKIVFADSKKDHPNICPNSIKSLITDKTKAIVPVHYAGAPCDMDEIMAIAKEHNLFVIEDAAQAIESTYKGKQLGTIGDLGTFSFHDTKNISAGEGGLLLVNNPKFVKRSEIIWEKGTNRSAFFRGEVNKYGWVDIGSSFLPSELNAAFLWAQLENIGMIQEKRLHIWNLYNQNISDNNKFHKAEKADNAHMFYIKFNHANDRDDAIYQLKKNGISATFHFLPLEQSPYFRGKNPIECPNSSTFSDTIIRLPLYHDLNDDEVLRICETLKNYAGQQ